MAAVCELCGKHPSFGMNLSHSHRRTKRRWDPNIQRVRALVDGVAAPGPRLHLVHPGGPGHQAAPAQRPDRLTARAQVSSEGVLVPAASGAGRRPTRSSAAIGGARPDPERRPQALDAKSSTSRSDVGDRDQQLVVLAAADRLRLGGAVGHRKLVEDNPTPEAAGQAVQVESEPVGDVHHRRRSGDSGRPTFVQTGLRAAVGTLEVVADSLRLWHRPGPPRRAAGVRPRIGRAGPVTKSASPGRAPLRSTGGASRSSVPVIATDIDELARAGEIAAHHGALPAECRLADPLGDPVQVGARRGAAG